MDKISKEKRSQNMAAIHSKDTKPELFLRRLLFRKGYRYSLHSNKIPGCPDMYMKKYNTAIFVHGCFWHRHKNCKYAYIPKSRTDFWMEKFKRNSERDEKVKAQLRERGIRILIVWECTIKNMMRSDEKTAEIINVIENFFHSDIIELEL